ncbi:EF-hand domain-containing protein [Govanella unica]|uniref:EF-hand domain-containing protein n=1 Tax=Govanella unica TaxID=2975056 RepID=A0A9X3Z7N8_9PROT|nr:EF-hand domain-containing protein [Govania unica]MDA5194253.1 EF-hand domain-containing protein [Govania unica]
MKLVRIMLLACSAAVALPAMAMAADQAQSDNQPPMYSRNGEHWRPEGARHEMKRMTKEEFQAKAAEAYKDADTNKDGKVTLDEFRAHVKREQERREAEREAAIFKSMDTNNDGYVTAEEFKAGADRMYERMEQHRGKWEARRGEHKGKKAHTAPAQTAPAQTPPAK